MSLYCTHTRLSRHYWPMEGLSALKTKHASECVTRGTAQLAYLLPMMFVGKPSREYFWQLSTCRSPCRDISRKSWEFSAKLTNEYTCSGSTYSLLCALPVDTLINTFCFIYIFTVHYAQMRSLCLLIFAKWWKKQLTFSNSTCLFVLFVI